MCPAWRSQRPTCGGPGYGNGPDNSRYFASRQIDKSNVTRLQVAWTYPFGDTGSSPIVVRGVVYGRGRNGSLVAVDAATGKELWVRENMTGMTSRGINYWESADGRDQRLIFAMNSLLQEVDAKTGKSIMSFGTNGVVDLRVGIDGRDPETIGNIQSNTPGEIFENLIILGSAPGEGYMSPPGDIRAYDVLTGKLVWTFHTVPRPGEFGYDTWPKDAWKYIGGTNNWGEMTIDTARGIAFIPLGSPTYDFYGADRVGANLFGTSIVALDARSGKRLWHFQLVHHDLWDLDPSAAPQLTTIRHNGRNRDVVAVTDKTGWLYVFDRVTGEPIWPIEERAGAEERHGRRSRAGRRSRIRPSRRRTSSTRSASRTSAPTCLQRKREAFKQRLLAADNDGIFTPIGLKDTVRVPASNGGTLFGGAAAEPRTGAVYIVAHDNPGIVRLLVRGEAGARRRSAPVPPGQAVYQQNCQMCHGPNREGGPIWACRSSTRPPIRRITSPPARRASTRRRFAPWSATGKGRMPPFPHLMPPDVDNLVAFLTTPRRSGAARAPVRPVADAVRSDRIGCAAGADRRIGIGVDAARTAGGSRPRCRDAVSGGDAGLHAIHDQRIPHGRQSHQAAVHDDREVRLERARDQVARPFGDDPALAARGITGTGAPAINNSIIVTASGLRVRRRAGQSHPRLGQRHGPAGVVGAVRRQLHRLAGDVHDGRHAVSARRGGKHHGLRGSRRVRCICRNAAPRLGQLRTAAEVAGLTSGAEPARLPRLARKKRSVIVDYRLISIIIGRSLRVSCERFWEV